MASSLTPEENFTLITQNLQEVLGEDRLKKILEERDAVAYWGTAPTGKPHLGYFVPLAKIADFLTAGVEVKVLLADVHAFLDNLKAPIDLVNHRVVFYQMLLTAVFRSLHLPLNLVTFVVGSSYQYSEKYSQDKQRLAAITTDRNARKAGSDVVKEVSSPPLSGMLYPLLQALDEEHLGVDFQFGGVDQRKIFTYAEAYLPKLGYKKRVHLMNKMVPGLAGGKMSSSDPNSKIDFLDSPEVVVRKIEAASCEDGIIKDNGVLAFVGNVIVPIGALMRSQGRVGDAIWVAEESVFTVEEEGGKLHHFATFEALEQEFAAGTVKTAGLKQAVAKAINALLKPIQEDLLNDLEFARISKLAYPDGKEEVIDSSNTTLKEAEVVVSAPQGSNLSASERFDLVTKNTTEVLCADRIKETLDSGSLRAYWDIMPTAKPKLDFFLPLLKIVDLAKAGVEVTILLADVDAYLGTIKSLTTVESLQPPTPRRNDYFQHLLSTIFSVFQIPTNLIKFVSASSFQYSQKYNEDLHVLSALTEEFEARDVQFPPSQGVEPPANLALRSLMSPIFQTLDQVNLKADVRIGTVAQRSTYEFSSHLLPKLAYSPHSFILLSPVPGVSTGKLSELDFLDEAKTVKTKVGQAVCEPGNAENDISTLADNEVISFVKNVLLPIGDLFREQGRQEDVVWTKGGTKASILAIQLRDGSIKSFETIEAFYSSYATGEIHPGDLKPTVILAINHLLSLVQSQLNASEEWAKVTADAYPVVVKVKKEKNLGTGGPGGARGGKGGKGKPEGAVEQLVEGIKKVDL